MGLVTKELIAAVARVLRVAPGGIDGESRLDELGIDSLVAVELATAIEGALSVKVPTMALLRKPRIARLAADVVQQLSSS